MDGTRDQMYKSFTAIVSGLKPTDDFLFHFSGHGAMMEGQLFLVPNDFAGGSHQLVPINEWMKVLNNREGGRNILILDCCRSDSSDDTFKGRSISSTPLTGPSIPPAKRAEFYIMFACDPGDSAFESRELGYFTESLLEHLNKGEDLILLGQKVNKTLSEKSPKQRSWVQHSFRTTLCL